MSFSDDDDGDWDSEQDDWEDEGDLVTTLQGPGSVGSSASAGSWRRLSDHKGFVSSTSAYTIQDEDAFESEQMKLIDQTAELLFVNTDIAASLLRMYRWDSERLKSDWFMDQEMVCRKVGLLHGYRPRTVSSSSSSSNSFSISSLPSQSCCTTDSDTNSDQKDNQVTTQCETAFCEQVPFDETAALACGHRFCYDCWEAYLCAQIKGGPSCLFTSCMGVDQSDTDHVGNKCKEMVPDSMFDKFLSDDHPELMGKYKRWIMNSYVEAQPHIKWCPNPACARVISLTGVASVSKDVTCECKHGFCFGCDGDQHRPAPCDVVKRWLDKEKTDDATEIWMAARTKECPSCKVRIEKNKACNHMQCVKCGHHFCWLCKGPWSEHGSATGGYYVCNQYNEDQQKGVRSKEEKDIEQSTILLQKYSYYYKRYKGSDSAIVLTQKLGDRIERKVPIQDSSFLRTAVKKLIEARRVLKWTYAVAYYLMAGKNKNLFEYQQQLLVGSTEALQDIMENIPVNQLVQDDKRVDIVNRTSAIDKFRQELIKQVESCDFEKDLLVEADTVMENWACSTCKLDNRRGATFCAACNACRRHGEMDCRACVKTSKGPVRAPR